MSQRRARALRAVRPALLGVVALAVAGCMPAAASTQGQSIGDLYRIFFGAGIFVALLVWGLVTFAIVRYRRRDDRLPTQIAGSTVLEVIWTTIPVVTVIVLFVLTVMTLNIVNARSPAAGVNVHVTAFRWQWQFDYSDAGVRIVGTIGNDPQLVVPVGEPVHVTIDAADVNHAFFVPQFLFKRDAIPGRTTTFDFTVAAPGTYAGHCAEFCGIYHDKMNFTVKGVSRPEFDAWLASERARPATPVPSTQPSASPSSVPSSSPAASGGQP